MIFEAVSRPKVSFKQVMPKKVYTYGLDMTLTKTARVYSTTLETVYGRTSRIRPKGISLPGGDIFPVGSHRLAYLLPAL